jgi:hypothetical protein
LSAFNCLVQVVPKDLLPINFSNLVCSLRFACLSDFGFEVGYRLFQSLLNVISPCFPKFLAKLFA